MMRFILSLILLSTLACTACGQVIDVPEAAVAEMGRRGDHIEVMGEIRSGIEAAQTNALATPEDDSDRWFINILVTNDARYLQACEQLLTDWNTSAKLRYWGDLDNPKGSWGHIDIKNVDDPKLADWFAGIKGKIEGMPFPIVHLQPPRNEKFGKNEVTVGMRYGYKRDDAAVHDWIQKQVKQYADKVAAGHLVSAAAVLSQQIGHAQHEPVGAHLPAAPVDLPSRNPAEWPDLKPPPPAKLTYKQVRALCPEAPAKWVRELVNNGDGVTSEDEVAEFYDEFLEETQEAKPDVANPQIAMSGSWDGLIIAAVGIVIVCSLVSIGRRYQPRPHCPPSISTNSTSGATTTNG